MLDELTAVASTIRREEIYEGLPDLLAMKLGTEIADPHPAAKLMATVDCSLAEVFAAFVDPGIRPDELGWNTIRAALNTPDIGRALTTAIATRLTTSENELMQDVERATRQISFPNYQPSAVPRIDVSNFEDSVEGGPVPTLMAVADGEEISIGRSSMNLQFSREALVNGDRVDLLAATFDAVSQASARTVAGKLADLLNDNAAFPDDGIAWFDSLQGNDLAGPGLNVENLSGAMAALAAMPTTTGEKSGIRGRVLIVPTSQQIQATVLVSSLMLSAEPPLAIATLPELDEGYWFLTGSSNNGAIALATLEGGPVLSVSPQNPGPGFDTDTLSYRVRNEFVVAPLSRNIIRVAVA